MQPASVTVDANGRRTMQYNVVAQTASISVNSTQATLLTYNGCYPGPTIRARQGDIVKIDLTNMLPATDQKDVLGHPMNITNLHTHGWHVSPEEPSDYVMYKLSTGQTYHHAYDLSLQPAGTLNLYHPHMHGDVARQFWSGLVGALVVEDSPDQAAALGGYETHILELKDITIANGSPAVHTAMDFMNGKEGDTIMVNGRVNPRLYIKAGQVQRWRIANTSNARFYKVALDGHSLYVIGTDGGLLDKPYPVSEVLLSPAERVDVLVVGANGSGSYKLKALPYARMMMGGGMGGGSTSGSQTITLMTLTYSGRVRPAQALPKSINPSAARVELASVEICEERTMTLSMSMGMGAPAGYIDGKTFDVDPYVVTSSMVGTWEMPMWEKWTIVNASMMDHPFHEHVNPAQVVSITGGDANYAALHTTIPAWKDVVLVPAMGSVTILVPVMDFTGMAMFHCHILEHEDIGMIGVWNLGDMGGM